jgi:hypothetical protein
LPEAPGPLITAAHSPPPGTPPTTRAISRFGQRQEARTADARPSRPRVPASRPGPPQAAAQPAPEPPSTLARAGRSSASAPVPNAAPLRGRPPPCPPAGRCARPRLFASWQDPSPRIPLSAGRGQITSPPRRPIPGSRRPADRRAASRSMSSAPGRQARLGSWGVARLRTTEKWRRCARYVAEQGRGAMTGLAVGGPSAPAGTSGSGTPRPWQDPPPPRPDRRRRRPMQSPATTVPGAGAVSFSRPYGSAPSGCRSCGRAHRPARGRPARGRRRGRGARLGPLGPFVHAATRRRRPRAGNRGPAGAGATPARRDLAAYPSMKEARVHHGLSGYRSLSRVHPRRSSSLSPERRYPATAAQ